MPNIAHSGGPSGGGESSESESTAVSENHPGNVWATNCLQGDTDGIAGKR